MKRCGLLVALLMLSLWAPAQTTGGTPVNTSTGTAYVNAPPSQPLIVAPIGHLGTAAPVAGATSATPGNMAGAVSSTMAAVPAMPPVPMVAEISNGVPVVVVSGPQAGASPILQSTSELTIGGASPPVARFNTGVGSFSGGYAVGNLAENQTSLGEIARDFRARRASEQARTFTNDDVQRLNQGGGGTSGVVTGAAGTMTQPTGNAPAVAQPQTMNPPAHPGVATPVPAQPQTNQPPPMSQMQSGTSTVIAQAAPPAGMEQRQAAPGGAETQRRGQLPPAASVLPLMALVGVLAAAAGLLAR